MQGRSGRTALLPAGRPAARSGDPPRGAPARQAARLPSPLRGEERRGDRKGEEGGPEPEAKSPRTSLGERGGVLCIGGAGGGVAAGQKTLGHIGCKK